MSELQELQDVATYIFTWFACSDACKKCRALHGRDFHHQNLYQNTLFDVIWGDIWDLNRDVEITHLHGRCQLTVRVLFNWDKWRELNEFRQTIRRVR